MIPFFSVIVLGSSVMGHGLIAPVLPSVTSDALRASISVKPGGKRISPDLFGIFFEDLNYAADGGLYAELVQNRSFEYSPADHDGWNGLTSWSLQKEEGGEGTAGVRSGAPLNANNPHYAVLMVQKGKLSLRNDGFQGMVLRKGETYDLSFFACAFAGRPGPIEVRLEGGDGTELARTSFSAPKEDWSKFQASLVSSGDAKDGRLVVTASGIGGTGLDMVSLFPRRTFHNRTNGLRKDLAQTIADLHPKFVRFPGGCLAHGNGLSNMYRWKDTVGPVEARRGQPNIWGYHQTVGLGYFEYFQFCEDIGAKPLPVVPAAVCCQNSERNWGKGQEGLPMGEMKAYIQEVLDLVEYANGSPSSRWGKVRAAAGHPKPFGLEYLAIGNEDAITPVFEARFRMIYAAVHAWYPKLKLIGTAGPFPDGEDFTEGWRIAREEKVGLVDEHYYREPDWFWKNLTRYDTYDRSGPKVFAGEYAAHEPKRENTLRAALAEAAHLTSLERNGDVVQLAAYAPLLAKQGYTQWRPDMIYFDNRTVSPSVNYEVQRLFMQNAGDELLPATVDGPADLLASSVVRDSKTGDVIVKLVSRAATPIQTQIDLSAIKGLQPRGVRTVLTGDPLAENSFGRNRTVVPEMDSYDVTPSFATELPPNSLTVIRIGTRPSNPAPPKAALEGYTADPAIRHFGNRYYLYPTSDKPHWQTTDFSVWSSPDLSQWTKERMVLDVTKDVAWANVEAWAPDCIERNGKYYFYFCAHGQVGVAVGDSPTGPFRDALGHPLVAKGAAKTYPIDPYPFIDEDGQAYLFLGNGTPTVFKLKPDMITLDGDPTYVPIKNFREGICVFKRKGLYYFMWSEDDARSDDYRVAYGTSKSPLGPVEIPADSVVLKKNGLVKGTGHHSVVNVPGTDRWIVAFHRHAIPGGGGYQRETCLAEMRFGPQGQILPIDPMHPGNVRG